MKRLVLGSLVLLAAGARPILAEDIHTLPPAVYGQMKAGRKLGSIWISPKFDGAKGFTVGQVVAAAELEDSHKNVIDYVPYALRRLAISDSPYVLSLTMTELSTVDRSSFGYFSASIGVEGRIADRDGNLLVAFRTREEASNRETVEKNCEGAVDKIVWSLSQDLGKPFLRALELRQAMIVGPDPSGLVPPPPPAAEAPLDAKGRLLRLDDLLKRGLITSDEYKAKKEEIVKGL